MQEIFHVSWLSETEKLGDLTGNLKIEGVCFLEALVGFRLWQRKSFTKFS